MNKIYFAICIISFNESIVFTSNSIWKPSRFYNFVSPTILNTSPRSFLPLFQINQYPPSIQVNNFPDSQLHQATSNNDYETVKKILQNPTVNINQQNSIGETALHIAARHGYKNIITLLLEHGANPNIQDTMPMWQLTPLHVAIMHNQQNAFLALLESPMINVTIKDASGEDVFNYALRENLKDFISILLNYDLKIIQSNLKIS